MKDDKISINRFIDASAKHFPTDGDGSRFFSLLSPFSTSCLLSRLYMADLDYAADLEKIGQLVGQLEKSPVISSLDTWYHTFLAYVNKRRKAEFGESVLPTNRN